MVASCLLEVPLKSSLLRRSRIHTAAPTTKKDSPVTNHIHGVNGLRKAQALEYNFLIGATTTSPDSIYGCVKSTIFVLFVVMVMSPTTASNSYIQQNPSILLKTNYKGRVLYFFNYFLYSHRL